MNFISSYIDLHMIYGISDTTAAYLRTFKNGMLNSTYHHGQHWLPFSPNYSKDCPTVTNPTVCYESGKVLVDSHYLIIIKTKKKTLHKLLTICNIYTFSDS